MIVVVMKKGRSQEVTVKMTGENGLQCRNSGDTIHSHSL
jgi:hypothetical protein